VSIVASDENDKEAKSRIASLSVLLAKEIERSGLEIELLGPSQCVIGRLRGEFRWQLVLKSADQSQALGLLKELVIGRHAWRGITVDVDPAWML
jgi:primosomal protein N'